MSAQQKKKQRTYLVPFILLCFFMAIIILFIALADLPEPLSEGPLFKVTENEDKEWGAEGEIGVFPDIVKPGDKGTFFFTVDNQNMVRLVYDFYITQDYTHNIGDKKFPFRYRLRMNNVYVVGNETENGWLLPEDLSLTGVDLLQGKQQFALEWIWPFDADSDLDTLIGNQAGKITLNLHLTATVREGDPEQYH